MARNALPCIVCGNELLNVDETATNQPNEGTTFQSYGQYGSTAYDPMDGRFIEINVCDPCLLGRHERVLEGRDKEPVVNEQGLLVWSEWKRLDPPWKLTPWNKRT